MERLKRRSRSRSPITLIRRERSIQRNRRKSDKTRKQTSDSGSDEPCSKSRSRYRSKERRSGKYREDNSERRWSRYSRSRSRSRQGGSRSYRSPLRRSLCESSGKTRYNSRSSSNSSGRSSDCHARKSGQKTQLTLIASASEKSEKSGDIKNAVEDDLDVKDTSELAMMKVMGFSNFESTNGKHVEGNIIGSISQQIIRRKYRQYMNRRGGFNRPLDFMD